MSRNSRKQFILLQILLFRSSLQDQCICIGFIFLVMSLIGGAVVYSRIKQAQRQKQLGIVPKHYDFDKCPYQFYQQYKAGLRTHEVMKQISVKHCKKLYEKKLKHYTKEQIQEMQYKQLARTMKLDFVPLNISIMWKFVLLFLLAVGFSLLLILYGIEAFQKQQKKRQQKRQLQIDLQKKQYDKFRADRKRPEKKGGACQAVILLLIVLYVGTKMMYVIEQAQRQRQRGIVHKYYGFDKCNYERYLQFQQGSISTKDLDELDLYHCQRLYQKKLKNYSKKKILKMQRKQRFRNLKFDFIPLDIPIVWKFRLLFGGVISFCVFCIYVLGR